MRALCAAMALATAGTIALTAPMPEPAPRLETWALVMDFRGQEYVLDDGLKLSECLDAEPRKDLAHGLNFWCEKAQG